MLKPSHFHHSDSLPLDSDTLLGATPGVMTRSSQLQDKTVGTTALSLGRFNRRDRSPLETSSQSDLLTAYDAGHSGSTVNHRSTLGSAHSFQDQSTLSAMRVTNEPQPGLVNLAQASTLPAGKGAQRYIIQFNDSVENVSNRANQLIRQHQGQLKHIYSQAFRGFSAVLSRQAIQDLKKQSSIAAIYEDVQVHLEKTKFLTQRQRRATSITATQSTPWGVMQVGGAKDGIGKTAWVIDTGVDYTHPDLKVDTRRAKSFVSSRANDDNGHGTHVAGTIAALNNSTGVVGVAAGATIVPVKVLNKSGSGYLSDVIAGVDYVARNAKAGDVANVSLGGGYYQPLNDAVLNTAAKGIKFAIAAGNESQNVATKSPASTNGVNVFTISAVDSNNNLASFSNYGAGIDYAAPGVGINSTWIGGTYQVLSGTSMATPHVAGLLLLGTPGTQGTVQNDRDLFAEGVAFNLV